MLPLSVVPTDYLSVLKCTVEDCTIYASLMLGLHCTFLSIDSENHRRKETVVLIFVYRNQGGKTIYEL